MRSRNIKPGFFKNSELADISAFGRLLFVGLWCLADRAGRLNDRPKQIKIEILPYDEINIDELLDDLCSKNFIHRYESGGQKYIEINNFTKHQFPHHREQVSLIPAPGKPRARPGKARLIPDSLNLIPDSPIPITEKSISAKSAENSKPLHVQFVDGFKETYQSLTGQIFKTDKHHFIIASKLVKACGYDQVVYKAKILGLLCKDSSAWFTRAGWADYTIEHLSKHWNSIIPHESDDQKKKREFQEAMKKQEDKDAKLNAAIERK